jgi:hypothetical protein
MGSNLNENLAASQNAVRAVDSNMSLYGGAANKPAETQNAIFNADPRTKDPKIMQNPQAIWILRAEAEKKSKIVLAEQNQRLGNIRQEFEAVYPGNPEPWTKQKLLALAALARKYQAGQCTEQVAIAFEYLINKGIKPSDFMIQLPRRLDHVFVVIGRSKSAKTEWDIDKPPPWGSEAVVCDPWSPDKANRSYPGAKIPEMMKLPFAVETLLRVE